MACTIDDKIFVKYVNFYFMWYKYGPVDYTSRIIKLHSKATYEI